ncbi:MAG: hypothetical protein KJ042_04450 [Deltaproteobacteria bacterium]|nr:hypothetical protein [Deltaproteobacteria bacterium]
MENVYESLEELELRRRWPRAKTQLASLVDHIRDIRVRANAAPLAADLAPVEQSALLRGLIDALRATSPPGIEETAIRRMARRIGDYFLWRREPTIPVIHELLVLAPWWLANIPADVFARLRDIGLEYVLNGAVKPVQAVWTELLSAPIVYMGHCTCRSSRVVEDLYAREKQVYLDVDEREANVLLDRFTDRFVALESRFGGAIPDCDAAFVDLARGLARARDRGHPSYRLETLLERTYPFWEFLPVIEPYTPTWIRSLNKNHKARMLHRELAFELATIMYLGKGVAFSTMQCFDQPYCICSCPTPENGGGCVLTHWYYASGSDHSLLPSDEHHGRRRDEHGELLPCDNFPIRAERACIGCGCVHGHAEPRGFETILAEADRIFASARSN